MLRLGKCKNAIAFLYATTQVDDLKQEISRLEQLQETKKLEEKLDLADKQCEVMEKKAIDAEHRAGVAEQRGEWGGRADSPLGYDYGSACRTLLCMHVPLLQFCSSVMHSMLSFHRLTFVFWFFSSRVTFKK